MEKLVRDRVPEIIAREREEKARRGSRSIRKRLRLSEPDIKELTETQYPGYAADKVIEEAEELGRAIREESIERQTEEFADVFQILTDLLARRGYTQEQIEAVKANNQTPLPTPDDPTSRYYPAQVIVTEIGLAHVAYIQGDINLDITHLLNAGSAVHQLLESTVIPFENVEAVRLAKLAEKGGFQQGLVMDLP